MMGGTEKHVQQGKAAAQDVATLIHSIIINSNHILGSSFW
jgi:hypothetical protein